MEEIKKTYIRSCKTKRGVVEHFAVLKAEKDGVQVYIKSSHPTKEDAEKMRRFYAQTDFDSFGVTAVKSEEGKA